MKRVWYMIIAGFIIGGCSGSDLPTTEESQRTITTLRTRVEMIENLIDAMPHPKLLNRDMEIRINTKAIDRILHALTHNRSDDIRISLPPTRHLIEQKKLALGIPYTNYIDIDSGKFNLNIRDFRIVSADKNSLKMFLHIEGKGRIAVSGKYVAIPASANPAIKISARDTVRFMMQHSRDGIVRLVPQRKNIDLEITVFIRLLAWDVPYKHTMKLAVRDIIQPVPLPMSMSSTISMLALKSSPDEQVRFVRSKLNINDVRTGIHNGWIHSAMNVTIDTAIVR